MLFEGLTIGFAITGSFCTFSKILPEVENLIREGAKVIPIISDSVDKLNTRFGTANDLKLNLEKITGRKVLSSIKDAEPIGPNGILDILVIAPCTGNTLAKIANAVTDTPVTMACKAHLRNQKPVVIGVSTNDGLGINAKNLGVLLSTKNIYMVPFGQDSATSKPCSLVAKFDLIVPTIESALKSIQIQPILV